MSSQPAPSLDPTPEPTPSGGDTQRSRKKNKKKYYGATPPSSYVGKCEAIKHHVYDVGRNADQFSKTTKEIAGHIARTVKYGAEFSNAMDPENLGFLDIPEPDLPLDPTDLILYEQWKYSYKSYNDKKEKRELATGTAYAIVIGQCSPAVIDRIEAHQDFDAINTSYDIIALLRLIRNCMYTGATTKDPEHALGDAYSKFYKFVQHSRMPNAEYLRTFKGMVDEIEQLGGELGVESGRITAYMKDNNLSAKDPAKYQEAKTAVRDKYLAVQLLIKSDLRQYGAMVANIQNNYTVGTRQYPTNLNTAYTMLVNYVNPSRAPNFDSQDAGLSFYQQDQLARNPRGTPRNCGTPRDQTGRGRDPRGRGRGAEGTQDAHLTHDDDDDEEQETGGNPNSSALRSYVHVSFNTSHAEHTVMQHGTLPTKWLLLDSGSTTDIVSNRRLLHDIHPADHPTWIRCNAGRVKLTHKGYLGDYPHAVWYNPKRVANILSLNNVSNAYRVSMDTANNKSMIIHKTDGSTINFKPSSNGLWIYKLDDEESVRGMWTMITTVSDKAKLYSKRSYDKAVLARKIQNIIMHPSTRKYHDTIIHYLPDCPITKADIRTAEHIFGPNLGSLKGKTVRQSNDHVETGIEPVPFEIMQVYPTISLAIDIMFVNKIAFFVTVSRDIKFGTVESLPNRKANTVKDCLNKVIQLYQSRGFTIHSILADHEFEPLRTWFPILNTTAADEHVPEVERYIRTIKDHSRSAYRMLPFKNIPRIILIHLIKNAVFWLNAFPTNDGASQQYSPRFIMTGQQLSFKKPAVIEFGAYVQTHEQHTNDMNQRTMGCICLGPTGNSQGAHWFMSLASGERVSRYRWTELPMPREAIDRVSNIGRTQHMPTTITYANRHGHEIADTVEDYPIDDSSNADDSSYDGSNQDDLDLPDDLVDESFAYDPYDPAPPPMHDEVADSDNDSRASDDDSQSDNDTINDDDADDDDDVYPRANQGVGQNLEEQDANQGVNQNANQGEGTPEDPNENPDVGMPPDNEQPGDNVELIEQPVEVDTRNQTEYERFQDAANTGRARANIGDTTRPRRDPHPKRDDDYIYTLFDLVQQQQQHCFVTPQMSAKAGLKQFGQDGADAIMKELQQLIIMDVIKGCIPQHLTMDQKRRARCF